MEALQAKVVCYYWICFKGSEYTESMLQWEKKKPFLLEKALESKDQGCLIGRFEITGNRAHIKVLFGKELILERRKCKGRDSGEVS